MKSNSYFTILTKIIGFMILIAVANNVNNPSTSVAACYDPNSRCRHINGFLDANMNKITKESQHNVSIKHDNPFYSGMGLLFIHFRCIIKHFSHQARNQIQHIAPLRRTLAPHKRCISSTACQKAPQHPTWTYPVLYVTDSNRIRS